MADNKYQLVEEDSRERCQGIVKGGQCRFKRMEGREFCHAHGGVIQEKAEQTKKVHDYMLQKWGSRIDAFSGSDKVKTLVGEIGVLRLTMENILNTIQNENEFLIYVDKISLLAGQITKTVGILQSIQEKNRDLLDKVIVFNIADMVVNIIAEHIDDPDTLNIVGEKLYDAITGAISGQNQARSVPQVSQ